MVVLFFLVRPNDPILVWVFYLWKLRIILLIGFFISSFFALYRPFSLSLCFYFSHSLSLSSFICLSVSFSLSPFLSPSLSIYLSIYLFFSLPLPLSFPFYLSCFLLRPTLFQLFYFPTLITSFHSFRVLVCLCVCLSLLLLISQILMVVLFHFFLRHPELQPSEITAISDMFNYAKTQGWLQKWGYNPSRPIPRINCELIPKIMKMFNFLWKQDSMI